MIAVNLFILGSKGQGREAQKLPALVFLHFCEYWLFLFITVDGFCNRREMFLQYSYVSALWYKVSDVPALSLF